MSDAKVEVGACGEVPVCPDNVQQGLRDFDARLRCVFNTRRSVWEIQERLKSSGAWSHVMFWHDGPWNQMAYRPLPFTAEPLIHAIQRTDLQRAGVGFHEFSRSLEAEGAGNRARAMASNRLERARKLKEFMAWVRNRWQISARRAQMGGRLGQQALRERGDVLRDLGLRR